MTAFEVVELTASQTHPLRLSVLRADTPTKEVSFAEDLLPGVVHLGIRDLTAPDGPIVATSTWVPRPYIDPLDERRDEDAVQLRGMATRRDLQGSGIGGMLLEAGLRRAAASGRRTVWARARDAALTFYERHGFEVRGEGFVDETTRLPHHLVVCALDGRR